MNTNAFLDYREICKTITRRCDDGSSLIIADVENHPLCQASLVTQYGRQNHASPDPLQNVFVLIPKTYESVTFHGKREDFPIVIKVKDLKMDRLSWINK